MFFGLSQRYFIFVSLVAILIFAPSGHAYNITAYLSIDGGYIGEVTGNVVGGYKRGCAYAGQVNLGLEFRSDSICNKKWSGAKFRVSIQGTHGTIPSENLIGDVQGVSNIAIGNHPVFLRHLFYSQEVGPVRFILGLQDINDEYDHLDASADFLNGSWGISPLFANVFDIPSYPNTSLAIDFKWNITPIWVWQMAAYDTPYPLDKRENPYNVNWNFTMDKGFQFATEFHCTPTFKRELNGAYKLGASYHLANDSVTETKQHRWGIYANIEQVVYNTKFHTVNVFAKGGYIPKLGQVVSFAHSGIGVTLQGIFSKHKRDMVGLGITSTMHTLDKVKHETVIEITYKYTLLECFYIQPDIQYVINPSLSSESISNALVLMLRLGLAF
ncbi:MAG: carbohydrate porin [Paludibacteraceae bacterium]|nr:carbohydrate porin [Paludibacteraceae bacterium]